MQKVSTWNREEKWERWEANEHDAPGTGSRHQEDEQHPKIPDWMQNADGRSAPPQRITGVCKRVSKKAEQATKVSLIITNNTNGI